MEFTLIRHRTDEGNGVFAAFSETRGEIPVQLQLAGGKDIFGELRPAVLRAWSRAMLAHLFGERIAARHADALAASDLVDSKLQRPLDWERDCVALNRDDVVDFLLSRIAPLEAA